MHSDENNKSGIVLSFDAVCAGPPIIIMLQKVNKYVLGKLEIYKFDY